MSNQTIWGFPNNKAIIVEEATYKKYVAFITQSGTTAPVAKVMENTLGVDVTYQYNSIGDYSMIFSEPILSYDFTEDTCNFGLFVSASNNQNFTNKKTILPAIYTNSTTLKLISSDAAGNQSDFALKTVLIELRVYPI